jgi:hypothetical protein
MDAANVREHLERISWLVMILKRKNSKAYVKLVLVFPD